MVSALGYRWVYEPEGVLVITSEELGRPVVLGHRGASAHAGDNTIQAFELAVAFGADGVELDVRYTADSAVMLHHDADIGEMGPLVHHDQATIRATHPEIPTLDEALDVLGDLIINVEIKNSPIDADYDPTHRMAAEIARWVAQHDLYDRVVVSSFNPETVAAVRESNQSIVTGQLVDVGFDIVGGVHEVAAAGHSWIAPYVSDLVADGGATIGAAHAAGLRVVSWTVDEPGDIVTLTAAGIDALISNDPQATLLAISAMQL